MMVFKVADDIKSISVSRIYINIAYLGSQKDNMYLYSQVEVAMTFCNFHL